MRFYYIPKKGGSLPRCVFSLIAHPLNNPTVLLFLAHDLPIVPNTCQIIDGQRFLRPDHDADPLRTCGRPSLQGIRGTSAPPSYHRGQRDRPAGGLRSSAPGTAARSPLNFPCSASVFGIFIEKNIISNHNTTPEKIRLPAQQFQAMG